MSADYEISVLSLTDPQGRELRVVQHFTDGIYVCDPVKLVVYDSDGQVVAETPYCRDVIARRTASGSMQVFGISFISDFFNRAWLFSGTRLSKRRPLLGGLAVTLASCLHRWWGYLIAVSFVLSGAFSYLTQLRMDDRSLMPGCWAWFGLAALFFVYVYTPLSMLVVLTGVVLGTLLLANDWQEMLLVIGVFGGWSVLWSLPFHVVAFCVRVRGGVHPAGPI